jgi:hypothetical protein
MISSDLHAYPKIVQAGRETELVILPQEREGFFDPAGLYTLVHSPLMEFEASGGRGGEREIPLRFVKGVLHARVRFDGEQEHALRVEKTRGGARTKIGSFVAYSLWEDLFRRKPFKGDLHIHSNRSDGVDSPGHVAAACRRVGMDFMALTDHGLYEPSKEAQRAFRNIDSDLRIFAGEEVHPPGNPVHIVNFGGSASVNELFRLPAYAGHIRDLAASFGNLPAGLDPEVCASTRWCFDRIRDFGGLGIFCHPYWIPCDRYFLPENLVAYLLDTHPWDALEVVGGYAAHELESNLLQVSRYHEERAQGRNVPVVGVSDAHGCETGSLLGWYYTVVFSPSLDLEDLISSIKSLYSVAVEAVPGGQIRAHGPYRLVRYAQFLLREAFPVHDELCAEEGRLMQARLEGDGNAGSRLAALKGRTGRAFDRYWATSLRIIHDYITPH